MAAEPVAAPDDLIEVATVAKAHGIRGEVLAVLIDPASETLGQVEVVWIGGVRYEVVSARPVGGAYLIAVAGVADRDAAALLRGQAVAVARDQLDLDEDDVLYADLVGCRCQLADGRPWGTIVAIELGPQDRLVIHDEQHEDGTPGAVERLLPLVDAFIASIDPDAKLVVVTPPDGIPEEPR
ncbi:MAG: ribosome maturation factor RimM [Kofleriaceae bacterium]